MIGRFLCRLGLHWATAAHHRGQLVAVCLRCDKIEVL